MSNPEREEMLRVVRPRKLSHNLEDYHQAASGNGPLAVEWTDKPHRLLYDLIAALLACEAWEPSEDDFPEVVRRHGYFYQHLVNGTWHPESEVVIDKPMSKTDKHRYRAVDPAYSGPTCGDFRLVDGLWTPEKGD